MTAYMVMVSDIIEKGTVASTVTSSPHGRGGPVQSPNNTSPEPNQIVSVCGNEGQVDGSVEWRKQKVMH